MKIHPKTMSATVAVAAIVLSFAFTPKTPAEVVPERKSLAINFKKDRLIEVAFLSVKDGKQQQLQQEYFAQVMPIAAEYGMMPLGKVQVKYTYSNFVKPQMIGFFEWPSEAKREAFSKDERFLRIRGIRNDALSSLRLSYIKVNQDTKVDFEEGKLVEIFGMFMDEREGHRMQNYFKNVMPLITGPKNQYNVQFPVQFSPVNYGPDSYVPDSFGLAIWKSKESNDAFFGSRDYARIKADKDAALRHLDVWHGEIIIP